MFSKLNLDTDPIHHFKSDYVADTENDKYSIAITFDDEKVIPDGTTCYVIESNSTYEIVGIEWQLKHRNDGTTPDYWVDVNDTEF